MTSRGIDRRHWLWFQAAMLWSSEHFQSGALGARGHSPSQTIETSAQSALIASGSFLGGPLVLWFSRGAKTKTTIWGVP